MINPRTIGTATPESGKALQAGQDAFLRIDRMAREAANAEQMAADQLDSYTPELDEAWAQDHQEILGDVNSIRDSNIDAWMAGNNPYDPSNDAYRTRATAEGQTDAKIIASGQHKKLFMDAIKLLNEKGLDYYDPQSYERVQEFIEAGSIGDRQAVLEKYDGQLLVRRPFDPAKYAATLVPDAVERTEQIPGSIAGTYGQKTTTEVTPESISKAAMGVVASTGWRDQALVQAATDRMALLTDAEAQAIAEEAKKMGLSPVEYGVYKQIERHVPDASEKISYKNLPGRTVVNVGGNDEPEYSHVARARIHEWADMYNGRGDGWVDVRKPSTTVTDPVTRATRQYGGEVMYRMHAVHDGLKIGDWSNTTETTQRAPDGKFEFQTATSTQSEANYLEKFIEMNGQVYYQTTESRLKPGVGVELNGLEGGWRQASSQNMEQLFVDMAKFDGGLKEEEARAYAASIGAIDEKGNILWNILDAVGMPSWGGLSATPATGSGSKNTPLPSGI